MNYQSYHLQVARADGQIRFYAHNGTDCTSHFADLASVIRQLPCRRLLLDGQAVVFESQAWQQMAAKIPSGETPLPQIAFFAFDLLELNGEDTSRFTKRQRRLLLQALLAGEGPLFYSDENDSSVKISIAAMLRAKALRGSPLADKPTVATPLQQEWTALKADYRGQMVIIGYIPSPNGQSFAGLIAARAQGHELIYAGRIDTGFDGAAHRQLARLFRQPAVLEPVLALRGLAPLPKGGLYWPKGALAEIAFSNWDEAGHLVQARFLGLKGIYHPASIETSASLSPMSEPGANKKSVATAPERVIFPQKGINKADIADYYRKIASKLLPHLQGRPLKLRCAPEGIAAEMFFQLQAFESKSTGIIPMEQDEDLHLMIEGDIGLESAVQNEAIEFYGRMVVQNHLNNPDRLAFGLDQQEGQEFCALTEAAFLLKDRLASLGLRCWPMLSGGRGLYLLAPLDRSIELVHVNQFARKFARDLIADGPQQFTLQPNKTLWHNKIFIDHERNAPDAMMIVPWSLRARASAGIAMPVSWEELKTIQRADQFSIDATIRPDPWHEIFLKTEQTIPLQSPSADHRRF